ncbi:hypothetical protein BDZ45DRAFT_746576 [Acephala macrosclerotiorum]|nr:hypothetical protein BDZ45DRAFT_746576 [Acephala macrosclerotiorum]
MSPKSPHVLIVGGGLGGLALAQTLRKQGISFEVFERDSDDHSRVQGWALSLHWTLKELISNIPNDLGTFEQTIVGGNLDTIDGGSFFNSKGERVVTFGGVAQGEEGCVIRCNRTKLRIINGTWVIAYFEDGTPASGDILVGADGLHSRVCKQLLQANPVEPMPTPYGIVIGEASLRREHYQQELEHGPSFYIVGAPSSHLFVGLKEATDDRETAYFYWMYF